MVLFFSGTGNSAYAARRIAAALGEAPVNLFSRISTRDRSPIVGEGAWVISAPTYCWQLPHVVRELLLETELCGCTGLYFILTCGDDIGGAEKHLRRLCAKKGVGYMGCAQVVMPENYIALFNAPARAEALKIIERAEPALDGAAKAIASGERLPEVPVTLAGRIKSDIVNPFYYPLVVRDKKFCVSNACVGCGECEASCPLRNIAMEGGRPRWGGSCTHCMACITRCPARAIEYGTASVGRERYACPKEE